MENREAFTGILAESEDSIEEVNWRQNNYNQRERGYSNRGSYRGNCRGSSYQLSPASRGRGYNSYGSNSGSNGQTKKTGTTSNPDVRCLICGLKGHKVTTCRKLARAQELIRLDKQQYWNKKELGKGNTLHHSQKQQVNEVDEAESINEVDHDLDEEDIGMDYNGLDELNFPFLDQAYYNDN